MIITLLVAFSLTVALFTVILVGGQSVEYDPWIDVNDDGKIDMKDIGQVARAFGATGTAINKTALLLELQEGLAELNATVDSLAQRVAALEALDTSSLKHCAGVEILTCGYYTPPPTVVNNYVKIVFPVTFTNASNINFSASGLVFSAATGVGHPAKIDVIEITTTYAILAMQGFNGASWVDLALDDMVQVSYVAIGASESQSAKRVVAGQVTGLPPNLNDIVMPASLPGANSTNTIVVASGFKIEGSITTPLAVRGTLQSESTISFQVWDIDGNGYAPAAWEAIEISYSVIDR
jgi:hypothetical protein